MAIELTKEQFESLPEFLQGEYKEVDGVYKNAAVMTLKSSLDSLDARAKETESRLSTFEQTKAQEIEEAKRKALEEARSSKDIEAIEKQYAEKMADLEKRTSEKTRAEVEKEFKVKQAQERATSLAQKLGAKLGAEGAEEDLAALIALRVKADENGNVLILNRDGSASTMTEADFEKDIKEKYSRLCKAAPVTTGSGIANGANGFNQGSAGVNPQNKALSNLASRLRARGM